jgi:DNA primase
VARGRELVQRVKDATDLAELVGRSVKLRRQGGALVGLCPFHSERTPSFSVVPDRGYYHCFGCGKHGDAFSWLMEREGMDFPEAMAQLAKAAGIDVPGPRAGGGQAGDGRDEAEARMRSALDLAQEYYQGRMAADGPASAYLRGRGIGPDFAAKAGLGFAPDGWENVVGLLRRSGYSPEVIEQTGLAARSSRGDLIDFMRNRLTIPIRDARGRLAAFGGRSLGEERPKYLNTRETRLFKKSETLYGLDLAKGRMRDGAILVEGYFDVLALQQAGMAQAVAPLGTAVTEEQLKALARFTKRVTLCFDGDEAGRRAAEKSLRLALPLGLDVRLLALPQGEDPDTWCARVGAEGFRRMAADAPDWVGFVMDRAREGRDARKASDRMEMFRAFKEHFAFMPRTPENWSLLQSVAAELGVPRHELNRALSERSVQRAQPGRQAQPDQPDRMDQMDRPDRSRAALGSGAAPDSGAGPGSGAAPDIDDLLRPFFVLCRDEGDRRRIAEMPADWWDHLAGARELQAVVDSGGDDALLPPRLLGPLRGLEAGWAAREESGITFERAARSLEKAYVLREIEMGGRLLKSPGVQADPEAMARLEARQARLVARKSALSRAGGR